MYFSSFCENTFSIGLFCLKIADAKTMRKLHPFS